MTRIEDQGLGQRNSLSLPPQRQTDGQTGEARYKEDSERWICDKLKGERKQTEQLIPPPPFPTLSSPSSISPPNT
jgi:hypothetical protein